MSIISYLECQAECGHRIFFTATCKVSYRLGGGGGGTLFGDSKCVPNRCCADHISLGGSVGMPPPPPPRNLGGETAALRSNVVGFGS